MTRCLDFHVMAVHVLLYLTLSENNYAYYYKHVWTLSGVASIVSRIQVTVFRCKQVKKIQYVVVVVLGVILA